MTNFDPRDQGRAGGVAAHSAAAASPAATEIADHLVRRIESGPLLTDPFEHSIVPDAFPTAFYRQIEAAFPSTDDGRDYGMAEVRKRRGHPVDWYSDRRLALNLAKMEAAQVRALPPVLRQLFEVVADKRVSAAMLGRFRATVKRRTSEILAHTGCRPGAFQVPLTSSVELIYDQSGFFLPPHTDGQMKLVTALVYFPRPGDPEDMGTHLYQAADPAALNSDQRSGGRPLRLDQVVHRGYAPYRSNLMLLFARSEQSLHGVPPSASILPRRVMQFSITFLPPSASADTSA